MKNRIAKRILLAGAFVLLASLSVLAQRQRGPAYDASAEITVKGTVDSVEVRGPEGRGRLLLTVKSGEETLNIMLGPAAYAKEKGFEFAEGDAVEVTGVKMDFRGRAMFLAREVKKGDKTLTLRDAEGRPKWMQPGGRGGRRGARGPRASGDRPPVRSRGEFTMLREEGFPLNVNPELVPAGEAGLNDGDMVMGIVHNGVARAYPVNYMMGPTNEVVNDTLGGTAVAASW